MIIIKKEKRFKKNSPKLRDKSLVLSLIFPISKSIPNNLGKSKFRTTAITVPRTSLGKIIVSSRILPDYHCPKSDLRIASPLPSPPLSVAAIPPHPFLVSLTPVDTVNFCFIARDFARWKRKEECNSSWRL